LFVALLVTLGAVFSVYSVKYQTKTLSREFDERAKVLLSGLVISSQYPVLIENMELLARAGNDALKQKDVVYCEIRDKAGRVLFNGGGIYDEDAQAYSAPITAEKTDKGTGEDMLLGPSAPGQTETIGAVKLVLSHKSLTTKTAEFRNTVIWLVIVGSLLAFLLITLLVKLALGRPINDLLLGIARISGGDIGYQVPVKTSDEIGLLASSFNAMS